MKRLTKILTTGAIILSTFLPANKTLAQEKEPVIDGWFEATAGIKQGPNLRLYPTLKVKGVKLNSLTDINNFYSFTKTDLSYDKLALKLGEHAVLKPVATFHANPYNKKITGDINLTAFTDKYFGFFELDVNPADLKNPEFITYHNLATKVGNFGLFATGPLKDIKSTYVELEFTGKNFKNSGISPYGRVNLMKGTNPTYQAGISVNPRKLVKKFKGAQN
jgi:hypothetical protein